MVCKERIARITGMHPDHVGSSHLDHHPHHTAGYMTPHEEAVVEREVEKMYGKKV